jgi:adenosyl cobinamide kinase/adenosyl cobinamide phosphate guanylyltransferase
VIALVLGGARSGKSALAESLAQGLPAPVRYLATGSATDPDMAGRIAAHRARRPAAWSTVEVGPGGGLAAELARAGTVLVDSLGTWLAGFEGFRPDQDLASALAAREGDSVVVSEEVGLGVHPATESGRRFRDALGQLNQEVARVADYVALVVAGRVLELAPPRGWAS